MRMILIISSQKLDISHMNQTAEPHLPRIGKIWFSVSIFRPHPVKIETVILTVKYFRDTNAAEADRMFFRFIRDSLQNYGVFLAVIMNVSSHR